MAGVLVRLFIAAFGLWLASVLIPGIEVNSVWTLLGAAVVLGLVNAVFRPLLIVLTLPFTIFTLGLFLLVINAALLGFVAWLFDDFSISGFWAALFGSLVISLTSGLGSLFIGSRGRVEVNLMQQRQPPPAAPGSRTIEGEYKKLDE